MAAGVYNLFVYGTLRRAFKSPAHDYISRFFSFVGDAKVKGKLFDLGPYPGGTPSTGENYIVGELYTIKNTHEFSLAIGHLDDYEGISPDPGEVQLYKRELVDVFMHDNSITFAWIYWYTGNVHGKTFIESGDMIQYLQQKE
jgi:gamma-glutamylcyclotransferase (GGCT)/AIG2-like uncharacterized protein YtfP